MTEVTIRHATGGDVRGIRRIARTSWTAAYGAFLSEAVIEQMIDEWYDPEIIARAVTDKSVPYFVAMDDAGVDDVIGYASGGFDDGTGRILTLYVHPDQWGGGIGTRLFESVLDSLRERDAERAEVRVLAENTVGIAFYESKGFERVREDEIEFGGATHREYIYANDL